MIAERYTGKLQRLPTPTLTRKPGKCPWTLKMAELSQIIKILPNDETIQIQNGVSHLQFTPSFCYFFYAADTALLL
jgi:hypothetical protein